MPRALAMQRRHPWPKGLGPILAATDEEFGNNFGQPAGVAPRKTEGLTRVLDTGVQDYSRGKVSLPLAEGTLLGLGAGMPNDS